MPTEKIQGDLVSACLEIESLGLDGFETEYSLTNKKTGVKTEVSIKIKIKRKSITKPSREKKC